MTRYDQLMRAYHRGALDHATTMREALAASFPPGQPIAVSSADVVSVVRSIVDEAIALHQPLAEKVEEPS